MWRRSGRLAPGTLPPLRPPSITAILHDFARRKRVQCRRDVRLVEPQFRGNLLRFESRLSLQKLLDALLGRLDPFTLTQVARRALELSIRLVGPGLGACEVASRHSSINQCLRSVSSLL